MFGPPCDEVWSLYFETFFRGEIILGWSWGKVLVKEALLPCLPRNLGLSKVTFCTKYFILNFWC